MAKKVSFVQKWFMAIRPSSLLLSSASVFLGIGMAFGDGIHHWPTALICLVGAWLLHILVNLANDYGDFEKGVDQKGEYDPMRGILVGEIPQRHMRNAMTVVLLLMIPPCTYLILRAGWPMAVIAVWAVISAIFYTIGTKPLGYRGLGDLLVLIFFGPAAVCGTYYAQSLEINLAVFLSSLSPGLFAIGVLTINNIRDYEKDHQANKKTLVVRFGKAWGKAQYLFVILASSLIPVLIYSLINDRRAILLSSLACFAAIPIVLNVFAEKNRESLDKAIGLNVILCFSYCLVFSLGWILR